MGNTQSSKLSQEIKKLRDFFITLQFLISTKSLWFKFKQVKTILQFEYSLSLLCTFGFTEYDNIRRMQSYMNLMAFSKRVSLYYLVQNAWKF